MSVQALRLMVKDHGISVPSAAISTLRKQGAPISTEGLFSPGKLGAWLIARKLGKL